MKFGRRFFQTKLFSRLSHKVCLRLSSPVLLPVHLTLSMDDDDGSENVGKEMNLRSFKLITSTCTRSICQMQATFPGIEFLRILFRFKKRKENSWSYVHVLYKMAN